MQQKKLAGFRSAPLSLDFKSDVYISIRTFSYDQSISIQIIRHFWHIFKKVMRLWLEFHALKHLNEAFIFAVRYDFRFLFMSFTKTEFWQSVLSSKLGTSWGIPTWYFKNCQILFIMRKLPSYFSYFPYNHLGIPLCIYIVGYIYCYILLFAFTNVLCTKVL